MKIPETPSFIIQESSLVLNLKRINTFRESTGATLILALKGFANWKAFQILNKHGFHQATASSLSEARLAKEEMGMPAHTYAPVYTDADIDAIASLSSHITFNSLTQYRRFGERVKAVNPSISIGLRLNPECSKVATDLYNPSLPGSRLGMDASQIEKWPEGVDGLHVHALCESSAEDTEALLQTLDERFSNWLPQLKWLNIGGGHLMTRKEYDMDRLIRAVKTFKTKYPKIELILEPGAAFVWDAGYLITTVEDIVENHGVKTAILDASFTAHMPDCLEMPYKPRVRSALEQVDPEHFPTYRLGGNSCLSGDYIGDWSFETPLKVGDRLIFCDMIHYTMVKTSLFNGVQHPSIVLEEEDGSLKLLKRFTYEDYKNRLS